MGITEGDAGSLGGVGFGGESTTIVGLSGLVGLAGIMGVVGFEIGIIGDDGGSVPSGIYPVMGLPPPGPLTGMNGTFPGAGTQPTGYPFPGKVPPGLNPGGPIHPGISQTADTMNMPNLSR